jgi:hypothetical protein
LFASIYARRLFYFNWEKKLDCKIVDRKKLVHQLYTLIPPGKKDGIADTVDFFFQGTDLTSISHFMIAFFESDDDFYSFFDYLEKTFPRAGHGAYIVEITGGKVKADQLDLIHTIIKQISDPTSTHFLTPKKRSALPTVESYDFE